MGIKAIILIGGPNKGQRFRPLSFDSPKYMFPVGGETIIGHLIESCLKLDQLSEIILLGFYQQDGMLSTENLQKLLQKCMDKNHGGDQELEKGIRHGRNVHIRYLQEFTRMGTGGGLYHFRDQIKYGNPEAFLIINGDVCGDFDFDKMLEQHRKTTDIAVKRGTPRPFITVMTTEAGRQESLNYGCIVENPDNHSIEHYVEKPSTFVSNLINCGAYVCSSELLDILEESMRRKRDELEVLSAPLHRAGHLSGPTNPLDSHPDYLSLELDVLQQRASQAHCFSYRTQGSLWCQVKTAASAIYANRQYLIGYRKNGASADSSTLKDTKLCTPPRGCQIIGDVYIHPTALVDPSAVIGPNVSIMENCRIGPGVRIKESIILQNAVVNAHSLVLCSIVGWDCLVGTWTRVEGTPNDPDPNQKFAKVQNPPLFNPDGKLNPSISVLGCNVKISDGTVILNTIVLPHKELSRSYKNEIVL